MKHIIKKINDMSLECITKVATMKQPKGITTIETILVIAVIVVGVVGAGALLSNQVKCFVFAVGQKLIDIITGK